METKKIKLDWECIGAKPSRLFQTEAEVRKFRADLEDATREAFKKYALARQKAWAMADHMILD
jgi:hypothetical protein